MSPVAIGRLASLLRARFFFSLACVNREAVNSLGNSMRFFPRFYNTREFKQIATAGATTAAVTEKVWGEYVSVVCQILAKRNTKMSET